MLSHWTMLFYGLVEKLTISESRWLFFFKFIVLSSQPTFFITGRVNRKNKEEKYKIPHGKRNKSGD